MNVIAKFAFIALAPFATALAVHDVFVFAEMRDRIDRTIGQMASGDVHLSAAVRSAFKLDEPSLHWSLGFELYRSEHIEKGWKNFHSNKILATPVWALELWIWYDRESLEVLRLRRWKADYFASVAFGKSLNDLTPYELDCVARFARLRRRPLCPEMAAVMSKSGKVN